MKMKVMRNWEIKWLKDGDEIEITNEVLEALTKELDWDEPITIEMLKDDDSELMKDYQVEIVDWIENNGDSIEVEWDSYGLSADFVIED